jgi:threonyl-tRNA synthetase
MIHRGVIGSMERMTAFLLEAYDGRLPIWLAPVQLCLLPVGASAESAADRAADLLRRKGIRVRLQPDGSLGRRIQDSRSRRDALIGVIGDSEAAADEITVDDPATGVRARLGLADLADRIAAAVQRREARVRVD